MGNSKSIAVKFASPIYIESRQGKTIAVANVISTDTVGIKSMDEFSDDFHVATVEPQGK